MTSVRVGDAQVALMMPQTFMNLSGKAVAPYATFFKIPAERVIVVHDEIDIPLGTLRIKKGGGDGGHNGIKSIAASSCGKEFLRVRVGVGRPEHPGYEIAAWVLGRFAPEHKTAIESLVDRSAEASVALVSMSLSQVQNKYGG